MLLINLTYVGISHVDMFFWGVVSFGADLQVCSDVETFWANDLMNL